VFHPPVVTVVPVGLLHLRTLGEGRAHGGGGGAEGGRGDVDGIFGFGNIQAGTNTKQKMGKYTIAECVHLHRSVPRNSRICSSKSQRAATALLKRSARERVYVRECTRMFVRVVT
jgi:hypothetical protein